MYSSAFEEIERRLSPIGTRAFILVEPSSSGLANLYDPSSGEELSRILDDSVEKAKPHHQEFYLTNSAREVLNEKEFLTNRDQVRRNSRSKIKRNLSIVEQSTSSPPKKMRLSNNDSSALCGFDTRKTMQTFLTSIGHATAETSKTNTRRSSPSKPPKTRSGQKSDHIKSSTIHMSCNTYDGNIVQQKEFKSLESLLSKRKTADTTLPHCFVDHDDSDTKPCVLRSIILSAASKSLSPSSGTTERLVVDNVESILYDTMIKQNIQKTNTLSTVLPTPVHSSRNQLSVGLMAAGKQSVSKTASTLTSLSEKLRELAGVGNISNKNPNKKINIPRIPVQEKQKPPPIHTGSQIITSSRTNRAQQSWSKRPGTIASARQDSTINKGTIDTKYRQPLLPENKVARPTTTRYRQPLLDLNSHQL